METIVSTILQFVFSQSNCFRLLIKLKCTASSPTMRVSSPFLTSIKAAPMARKGLQRINETCVSSSISITTKSTGKMNFPTLISTSSRTPSSCAIVLFAICKVIAMGVSYPKLSLFTTDNGIKLMLAPESHKAFLNSKFPMVQGMVKLPGSYIFSGKLFWITTLHFAVKFTTPSSENFLFLLRMSFRNLA